MRKSNLSLLGIRVLIYIFGLFCLAMGVAISANSNLGISPVNSLPYVLSAIIPLDPGTCVILVFCSYIVLQALLLRRSFKPVNFTQIIFSSIFGYFVNFTKLLVGDFSIPTYAGKLAMQGISIVLIALGVIFYIEVELVPMPMEGLSLALANKLKVPFHNMKIIIDCLVVALGIALSMTFLGKVVYIREGTIITAVVTGKVIALFKKPLSPVLRRLCFAPAPMPEPRDTT